ncbi:ER membrane protein complex subunit 8-like [Homarus americanus]|uniref:ER membrane protein complex subunit 8-like n=1 Tax=Homarus americanus TaxID=6706 RepID=A0A8J5K8K5_HOMAM|nr:ER membrane protein complex subunit 8-like [Homarus americanus]
MKVKACKMSGDISLACSTLSKMLLHAARYPQSSVSGVVLAQARGGDTTSNTVVLVDAVPLFHLQLSLAPMLEVALTQIEQRYKSEGLIIAGYYQANEHIRDNVPDFVALKIAEKIAENNNDSCLIMIDNKRMCLNLIVHVEAGSLEVISQLLQRRVQHDINDFDNHLDDLTCDWSNPHINKVLTTLTAAAQD